MIFSFLFFLGLLHENDKVCSVLRWSGMHNRSLACPKYVRSRELHVCWQCEHWTGTHKHQDFSSPPFFCHPLPLDNMRTSHFIFHPCHDCTPPQPRVCIAKRFLSVCKIWALLFPPPPCRAIQVGLPEVVSSAPRFFFLLSSICRLSLQLPSPLHILAFFLQHAFPTKCAAAVGLKEPCLWWSILATGVR